MSKERKKAVRKPAAKPRKKTAKAAEIESTTEVVETTTRAAAAAPRTGRPRRGKPTRAAKAVETEAAVPEETVSPARVVEIEDQDDDDRGPIVVTAPESETWESDVRPAARPRRAGPPRPVVRGDVEPPAPGAVVEKKADAIIVRFPPVAPPPFETAPRPAARAAERAREETPPAPAPGPHPGDFDHGGDDEVQPPGDLNRRDDDRGDRRGRRRRGGRGRGREGDRNPPQGRDQRDRGAGRDQRNDSGRGQRQDGGRDQRSDAGREQRGGGGRDQRRGRDSRGDFGRGESRPEQRVGRDQDHRRDGGRDNARPPENRREDARRDDNRRDDARRSEPQREQTREWRELPPRAPAPAVPPDDAPETSAEQTENEALGIPDVGADGRKLSPSQKRRLRRKRRQQLRDSGAPVAPASSTDDESDVEALGVEDAAEDRGDAGEFDSTAPAVEESATTEEVEPSDRPAQDERRNRDERGGRGRRRGRGGRGRGRYRDRDQEYDRDAPTEIMDTEVDLPSDETEPELEDRVKAVVPEPDVAAEIDDGEDGEGEEVARPAGRREMVINVVPLEESRIAILNEGKLEEIYIERRSSENHVGNIYKGVITNVEPSIQAAFIDFGLGKNGFLHISDLHPRYFPHGGRETENVGRKTPRRHRPPIQRCLRRGQELIVQITKEGIGTKGPTLTTYLSIPGRFLVMMPGMARLGVSRKVEDDSLRDTLRDLLSELELPDGMGFIARTAAVGRSTKELQNDLNYLLRLWRAVDRRMSEQRAPAELYRESDLVIRTIRDVFTDDISRLIVDDAKVAEQARQFLSIFNPHAADLVQEYSDLTPIFHRFGIEQELERLHSRHVPLASGGSLIIDQTEALVAIDVNSGRYRTEDDAEQTAFKINQEAADEIPRQLRLRDLGGVIICDFIDMREERHRRDIERRMVRNLKQHKERAKVLRMSSFGIIELTRQRQRASLQRSVYQDCTHCRGSGLVKTAESVTLDVIRQIQLAVTRDNVATIELNVSPDVANQVQNRKRGVLNELEAKYRRNIWIKPDSAYGLDQVQIQCFDGRGRPVAHQ